MCDFLASGFLLFGHSSVYHLGNWGERVHGVCAGLTITSSTSSRARTRRCQWPLVALDSNPGARHRVERGDRRHTSPYFPDERPALVLVTLYVALGWVAMWFLPNFWDEGGAAIVILLLAGGGTYTIGACSTHCVGPTRGTLVWLSRVFTSAPSWAMPAIRWQSGWPSSCENSSHFYC